MRWLATSSSCPGRARPRHSRRSSGGRVAARHRGPCQRPGADATRRSADGSPAGRRRREMHGEPGSLTTIFLHPPFDAAGPARARSSGPSRCRPPRPATLAGYALRGRRGTALRVALVPAPGGGVAGRLVGAAPDARAPGSTSRWRRSGGAAGGDRVEADGARRRRRLRRRGPDGRSGRRPAADRRGARARLVEALAEIMGHFGRRAGGGDAGLLHGIGDPRAGAGARRREPRRPPRSAPGSAPPTSCRSSASSPMPASSPWRSTACATGASTAAMSETIDRAVFTSGDAITVLPFDPRAGHRAPDRAVPRRPLGAPRPAALVPRDRRRALRPHRAARGDRPARGARGGGADARADRADRRLLSLAGDRRRVHHLLRRRGRSRRRPAASHGLAEEHEDIRTLVVPLEAALAAIETGEISNAPADGVAALARPARRAAPRRLGVSALDGDRPKPLTPAGAHAGAARRRR